MKWTTCITAFISTVIVFFPQNIIGCGPDADPYNYYTSFFYQNLPEAKGYMPFYYTGYNFLYDETEPVETTDVLATEWASYCGAAVTPADAKNFIHAFALNDINNLYYKIEKNIARQMPDSMMKNTMALYFMNSRDLEGLGYILFARKVEPYVIGDAGSWEPVKRDEVAMDKYIKNGQQLYTASKKDLFRLKYGYQILRLAMYSNRYKDALNFYDTYIKGNTVSSVLQGLCISLKAGALRKLGDSKQAAYLFSKAFSGAVAKRVSNYISFKWSVNDSTEMDSYLAYCKNNEEKANMLTLFALGNPGNGLQTLENIYALNAGCEGLEVLVTREINKLEEKYLTPVLQKEKGGKTFYYTGSYGYSDDSIFRDAGKEALGLASFLHTAAKNKSIKNPGLIEAAAAYAAYMVKDYATANKYVAVAEKMALNQKTNDQLMLTKLLMAVNEQPTIDAAFEQKILPVVQWLQQKAHNEITIKIGYDGIAQWKTFYGNFMSEVLAKRYHVQRDFVKEALVIGAAGETNGELSTYEWSNGVYFLRDQLGSKDVEKLYGLFTNKNPSAFDHYLLTHNSISKSSVTEFAGTAYLREYDYTNAITWFNKSTNKKALQIFTNPFVDLLYDLEEPLPGEAKYITTKPAFAQEMKKQMALSVTDKANAAKHYYKIANGLYNITYYGHAWQLVQYSRSGTDGYSIPDDATPFQKEYYGCFTALTYFKKAMEASPDKNFKAKCLFMMARCSQKQVQKPSYDGTKSWDSFSAAEKDYYPNFKNNRYFPELIKEYSKTPFYEEAFSTCSYLRDFEMESKTAKP